MNVPTNCVAISMRSAQTLSDPTIVNAARVTSEMEHFAVVYNNASISSEERVN